MRGIYFNGNWITKPGAYADIDALGMTGKTNGIQKVIALIGESEGGVPGEIMWFDNPTSARRVLRGGELLKGAEKAWAPTKKDGKIGEGAGLIGVIRANEAKQSSLKLGNGKAITASIGEAIKNETNVGSGIITSSGTYTGTTDEIFEIIISSEGSNLKDAATFKWKKSTDSDWSTDVSASGDSPIELSDGVAILLDSGTFNFEDRYVIKAIAAKDEEMVVEIVSKDYGAWTRKLQVKLETGELAGTKKLTVFNWEDNKYEVYDNLGVALILKYTGDQSYSAIEIIPDIYGKAKKLVTKIGSDKTSAIEDIAIDLTDTRFSRLQDVANYINGFSNYVCEIHEDTPYNLIPEDLDSGVFELENGEVVVTAFWMDMKKRIANESDTIEITNVSRGSSLPVNIDFTNLQGGSNGTVPSSWIQYFDKLSSHPITYLVPMTGDMSIHSEARAHADFQSKVMGREVFVICGGYKKETIEKTKSRAKTYNSDRVQLVYPGFYDREINGDLVLYPSYVTAAMHAGRAAFLEDGESATFDYYNIDSLEYELQPDQISELLTSGVAPFEFVLGKGNRLVQDITTHTDTNKSLYTERSVRVLADSFNKELREKVEELIIGKGGTLTSVTSVKNLVIGFLKEKMREEKIVGYRNVTVTYNNKVIYIEYEAAPVEPTNFALIQGHFYTAEEILIG